MVNLYNFMDGMDGAAGGMAVAGFGSFGVLGGLGDQPLYMSSSLVIAGAAAGFLLVNFPPARIFMGDIGSSLLDPAAAQETLLPAPCSAGLGAPAYSAVGIHGDGAL